MNGKDGSIYLFSLVCCYIASVDGGGRMKDGEEEMYRMQLHSNDPSIDASMQSSSNTSANAHLTAAVGKNGRQITLLDTLSSTTTTTIPSPGTLLPLLSPRNLTLLRSGLDPDGKAYLQISWLPPPPPSTTTTTTTIIMSATSPTAIRNSSSSVSSVDRYRITWRMDQFNSKEEFRKTVDGDTTSYTIEHLEPNVHIVVDVQAFRWIEERKLRSAKTSITVRTASRRSTYDTPTGGATTSESFALTDDKITVNTIFFQNGLLKANLSWSSILDVVSSSSTSNRATSYTPSFVVRWYPKVCLDNNQLTSKEKLLVKPLLTATNINSVLVYDLNFNCRYAVAIYQRSQDMATGAIVERLRGVKHFLTPACQDVTVVGNVAPNCPQLSLRLPGPPQNLSCFFLVQMSEITATCSWEPPMNFEQSIVGYRIMYARKLLDPRGLYGIHPFPVFDRNSLVMKVLDDDEMSFSITRLEEEAEYIVHIQAISAGGFGTMTRLEFVTPRLIHSANLALSQSSNKEASILTTSRNTGCNDNNNRNSLLLTFNLCVFLMFLFYSCLSPC